MQRKELILDAMVLFEQQGVDFSDALIAAEMAVADVRGIYSYDRHFDRVAEVERVEP